MKMASTTNKMTFWSKYIASYKTYLEGENAIRTGIIAAVTVVLLSIILLYLFNKRRNLRRTVLLVGLCDSGKTLLFSQLIHQKPVGTHTSIKENTGTYTTKKSKKSLRIVDLPGHDRLRNRFFENFKTSSRGLIFLIDSLTIQSQIKDVAEFLYILLSDKFVAQSRPSILIACNKQDQALAKSSKVIKGVLEKEMNMLRVTRSSMLDSTDNTSHSGSYLGKRDKDFEFEHLHPLTIDVAECSAVASESKGAQLSNVEEWLNKIA